MSGKRRKKRPGLEWSGIVKVQREQAPNPDATVRINNRLNSIMLHAVMTPGVLKMFREDAKFYAYSELRQGSLEIVRRVAEQDF